MKLPQLPIADLLAESRSGFWGGPPGSAHRDVRVIRNGDLKPARGILWDALPTRAFTDSEAGRSAVAAGDLLMTSSGDCGTVAMVLDTPVHETCASNFLRILRFDRERVYPRYAFHFMQTDVFTNALRPFIRGTTLKNLSTRDAFRTVRIPVPPVDQQRRIADILDRADALRAKRREALALLDDLTQSIFLDMFGDVFSNPRGFATSTVGDVATQVTDGEHLTPPRESTGVPLLSARNVRDGYLDLTNVDYVSKQEFERLRKRLDPEPGDILISCSGTIGRVAQVGDEVPFAMVRSAALVRVDTSILTSTFMEHQLRQPNVKALMIRRANSSSQANLFQKDIRPLPVLIPPLGTQRLFDQRIAEISRARASQSESQAEIDQLFVSLQQRAFAGEL